MSSNSSVARLVTIVDLQEHFWFVTPVLRMKEGTWFVVKWIRYEIVWKFIFGYQITFTLHGKDFTVLFNLPYNCFIYIRLDVWTGVSWLWSWTRSNVVIGRWFCTQLAWATASFAQWCGSTRTSAEPYVSWTGPYVSWTEQCMWLDGATRLVGGAIRVVDEACDLTVDGPLIVVSVVYASCSAS